ncbi:MAG: amino acid permease [Myxococcota bacterium]
MTTDNSTAEDASEEGDLKKELGLFDVYAICTGAMFSSGFFLLPGIAAAQSGPSVVLAYFLAGLLILPAALCVAELSTAMPKAGGAYYFLDRALGPVVGSAGGVGTWVALILKSSFALIGMGAYLTIFVELPIKPVAVALIVAFTAVNVFGAKETGGLQKILVATLVAILTYFVVQGFFELGSRPMAQTRSQFDNWLPFGVSGLFSTVGLVFVSFAGLTKVASVSEEVDNPSRNIPLGILLSLVTAIVIYTLGVFIMVGVLEPTSFREDLKPVATAAEAFFTWLPGRTGVWMIVIAAIAAFASTGNAGLMSASRYPLAMARDRLVPSFLSQIGRFDTPTYSILITSGVMIFAVVALDVATLAKLASATQLVLFAMLCLAVIVMRESEIEYYQPGFRTPLYPWLPLVGLVVPFWLVAEMGAMSMLFSGGLILAGVVWYFMYSVKHVEREGAIFHVFERLGRSRDTGLRNELRLVLAERGLEEGDYFEGVVADAEFIEVDSDLTLTEVLELAASAFEQQVELDAETLVEQFQQEIDIGLCPRSEGILAPHLRIEEADHSHLLLIRMGEHRIISDEDSEQRNQAEQEQRDQTDEPPESDSALDDVCGFLVLISPKERTGEHLRLLAQIAGRIEEPDFREEWKAAETEAELKSLLLRDERFHAVRVVSEGPTGELVGRRVSHVDLPEETFIGMIRRDGKTLVPHSRTTIEEGDEIVVLGDPEQIEKVDGWFGS